MKFKIGDKVKVICTGVIVHKGNVYDWLVKIDGEKWPYNEVELEKVLPVGQ